MMFHIFGFFSSEFILCEPKAISNIQETMVYSFSKISWHQIKSDPKSLSIIKIFIDKIK